MGHKRPFGTIVEIGDILVSEDVILEYFACDYPVCKGQCCIVGDSGAPLKEEELDSIEANYDVFSPLMRPDIPRRKDGVRLVPLHGREPDRRGPGCD